MTNLLAQAQAAAAKLVDQTSDSGGGTEYTPPAAGPCIARLVSYIEIGTQEQPAYQGTAKKPTPECILEFQLLGKKHAKEIEVDNDGVKTAKTIYPIIRVGRSQAGFGGLTMPGGSKSNHFKLLKAMDYGRGIKHMALMLGEAFIVTVVHKENGKEGAEKRVYANLKDSSGWKIGAPVNPTDGEPIAAPEATVEPRLLLWDAPSIEQWNSIYISGSYTKKVGDETQEVSRNWIQPICENAVNFEGSALQVTLASIKGDLPVVEEVVETTPTPDTSVDVELPSLDLDPLDQLDL